MPNQNELDNLIEKYLRGQASSAEVQDLLKWYRAKNDLKSEWPIEDGEDEVRLRILNNIRGQIYAKPAVRSRTMWYRGAAAAIAILILFSITTYYKGWFDSESPEIAKEMKPRDIQPGSNKAILTLGDGSTIVLDNAKEGILTNQGKTVISKSTNGQLVYDATAIGTTSAISYNSITTPRGGKYQLILPDGSRVWLNAGSSLRFPTAFTEKQRNVELSGEAYFEVAENKLMPFIVQSGKQSVKVLGTHFNINSYSDEPVIKTTLLEGSIELSDNRSSEKRVLMPGFQGIIGINGKIQVNKIDASASIAWKEGFFHFKNSDLKSIMRQASRWYDVEVSYNGKLTNETFTGEIPSDIPASVFLDMLSFAGVKFQISGKKIIVTTT